jgi:hypothetical protein
MNLNGRFGTDYDETNIWIQNTFKLNEVHTLRHIPCRPNEYPFQIRRCGYKAIG